MAKKIAENWRDVFTMTAEVLSRITEVERIVRALSEHKLTRDPEVEERRRPKRARVFECTQEAFDKLPGMVSRSEFQDWTGLNKQDLSEAVSKGEIDVYRNSVEGHAKYYKREIARLTGFKL